MVGLVQQVHDVEPNENGAFRAELEPALQAEIKGLVRTILHRVGKSAAQAVPVKSVDRRFPIIPSVGNAGRTGETLIVVEENPVVADVGELIGIEEELRGADLRPTGPFVAGVYVSGERTVVVAGSNFAAIDFTALVIER